MLAMMIRLQNLIQKKKLRFFASSRLRVVVVSDSGVDDYDN